MDGRVYLICPLGFVEVPVENGEWDPSCQFQCFFSQKSDALPDMVHGVIKHGVLKSNHLVFDDFPNKKNIHV